MKITKCPPGSALAKKPNYKKQRRQSEYQAEMDSQNNETNRWIREHSTPSKPTSGTRRRNREYRDKLDRRLDQLEATVKALTERVAKLES